MSNTSDIARTATILPFRRNGKSAAATQQKPVLMASTIELYSTLYPTPSQMLLLVDSWLFAAQRDGMAARRPEYVAALRRTITALRFSDTLSEAIAFLRKQEAAANGAGNRA
jgi:hypothetical protein